MPIGTDMREYDDDYTNEYEVSYKRRSRGAIVVMIVLGLAIVAVIAYTYILKKTTYTTYDLLSSVTGIPNAAAVRTQKGFILYNNDGAEGHDETGNVIWKVSYDLASPIAAVGGDYAAFADMGANVVHVTDGTGSNHVINVSEKISDICVASQGVTAVRTDGGDSDHIYIYDISGNMLLDIKTEVRKTGFPVAMALSSDGRKLVTSYLQVGQTQESWITFYNFGDVGQSYADKIVGSYSFEDSLIPDVRFIGDERVLVTDGTNSILYKFREIPEEMVRLGGEGVTASVTSDGGNFAVARKLSDGTSKITIYNSNGSAASTVETGMAYDRMCVSNGELILMNGDSCVIYRKNGKEKFRSRLNSTIELAYSSGTNAAYTVVENGITEVIKLKAGEETVPTEAVPSAAP